VDGRRRRRRGQTVVGARHECATLVAGRHYGARVNIARGRSVLVVAFHRQSVLGQEFVEVTILKPNV